MPPEPKKPIEELLETSAQKRRAEFGADPAMPNPMRARLHDEIAGRREATPRKRWFAFSWPRLALGTAFACLLLGAGSWLWRSREMPNDGARFATATDRLEMTAPAAPPTRTADAASAAALLNTDAKSALAKNLPGAEAPAQTFSQAAADSLRDRAGSDKSEAAAENRTQQFAQTKDKAASGRAARPQAPRILDNFKVEQNGRDIRVVDEDGSTYTGRIEELAPNDQRNILKAKRAEAEAQPAPAAAPAEAAKGTISGGLSAPNTEFHFRASGYNDRLQKPLVFEGNYIVEDAPARMDLQAGTKKPHGQLSARILGTAKVQGQSPVQIEAVTVPPK